MSINLEGGHGRTRADIGKYAPRHIIMVAQTRINEEAASTGGDWTHQRGSPVLRAALLYLLNTKRG